MHTEINTRAKAVIYSAGTIIDELYNSKIGEKECSDISGEEYRLIENAYRHYLSQLEYLIANLKNVEEKENAIYSLEEVIQDFIASSDDYIEMCKKTYFKVGYGIASELIYDTTKDIPVLNSDK